MWPVAQITFLDGFRSRILHGIFLFSLFVMVLSIVFSNFFMHDIGKIAVDFNLSAITLAGLLLSFSVTVNLIAQDLEKKTIHFVLSKPVTRSAYIRGKYLGIQMLTFVAYLILVLASGATLLLLHLQSSQYFAEFSTRAYLLAILLDFFKLGLLNALILFFATFASNAFITTLFSLASYIIGQSISEVFRFLSLQTETEISPVIHAIIQLTRYLIPNFELFDIKVPASHGLIPPMADVLIFVAYGILYSCALLYAASLIFERKEFP